METENCWVCDAWHRHVLNLVLEQGECQRRRQREELQEAIDISRSAWWNHRVIHHGTLEWFYEDYEPAHTPENGYEQRD